MMLEILRRGQERGQVRKDVDTALVLEMLIGAHFARQFNGRPFSRDWAGQIVDTIWPALEPRTTSSA